MNKYLYIISASILLCSCVAFAEQQKDKDITINDLAFMFKEPPWNTVLMSGGTGWEVIFRKKE